LTIGGVSPHPELTTPHERLAKAPVTGCIAHGYAFIASAGSRFVPRPEERLLLVVHALLHRCYKLPFSNTSPVGFACGWSLWQHEATTSSNSLMSA